MGGWKDRQQDLMERRKGFSTETRVQGDHQKQNPQPKQKQSLTQATSASINTRIGGGCFKNSLIPESRTKTLAFRVLFIVLFSFILLWEFPNNFKILNELTTKNDYQNQMEHFAPTNDKVSALTTTRSFSTASSSRSTNSQEKMHDDSSLSSSSVLPLSICNQYDGILHISQGDSEGAAGTIFFLFVLNQLLYAQQYNLLPWIHLNDMSKYVYDPIVHGNNGSGGDGGPTNRTFRVLRANFPSMVNYTDPISNQLVQYPGPPFQKEQQQKHKHKQAALIFREQQLTITGNGVWESYFEPISPKYSPGDCPNLPFIKLHKSQLLSIHTHWPMAIRAWRYGGMPPSLTQYDLTYNQWFAPMRNRGSELVETYVRPKAYLQEMAVHQKVAAVQGNSLSATYNEKKDKNHCLAIHIRHSDKANRRKRIPVKKFLPYVQAYYEEMMIHANQKLTLQGENDNNNNHNKDSRSSFTIYLATDSSKVITNIQQNWPSDLVKTMIWQNDTTMVRSNDTTPVFTMTSSHHMTNIQVLVDILAMSRCQFLLHGLSAVSEATMYFNRQLHPPVVFVVNNNTESSSSSYNHSYSHSVNLEVPAAEQVNVKDFRKAVRNWMTNN